jgi:hypothetical protein
MKTPEQLADEHTKAWWGDREDNMTLATRQAFIAGYKAGYQAGYERGVEVTHLTYDAVREHLEKKEFEIIQHELLLKDYK